MRNILAILLVLVMLVVLGPATARADYLYKFNLSASSSINPFSFSFTVPTFVASGDTPAFTPFTVTDGTNTWTMANDLASHDISGNGCLAFGSSAGASLSPCGITVTATVGAGAFYLIFGGGFPTTAGAYSTGGVSIFHTSGGSLQPDLHGTLDITSTVATPEPSSMFLLGTGLLGLGPFLRRRIRSV